MDHRAARPCIDRLMVYSFARINAVLEMKVRDSDVPSVDTVYDRLRASACIGFVRISWRAGSAQYG